MRTRKKRRKKRTSKMEKEIAMESMGARRRHRHACEGRVTWMMPGRSTRTMGRRPGPFTSIATTSALTVSSRDTLHESKYER